MLCFFVFLAGKDYEYKMKYKSYYPVKQSAQNQFYQVGPEKRRIQYLPHFALNKAL